VPAIMIDNPASVQKIHSGVTPPPVNAGCDPAQRASFVGMAPNYRKKIHPPSSGSRRR